MYAYINTVDGASANDGSHAEIDPSNVLKVTEDQLNEDQKQKMAQAIDEACLQTFSMVGREGKVIQKTDFPMSRHITIIEDSVKFQEIFDQAMHHALINQSNVMKNFV